MTIYLTETNVDDDVFLFGVSSLTGRPYRTTLAHIACLRGSLETVLLLVSLGSNQFETLDDTGLLPIHYAVERNHSEIVEFLVNRDPMCLQRKIVDESVSETILTHLTARSDQPPTIYTLPHRKDASLQFFNKRKVSQAITFLTGLLRR